MKWCALSNLNGNAEALTAVLHDAAAVGVDRILCIGVAGTAGHTSRCLADLSEHEAVCVAGPYDAWLSGVLPKETFEGPQRSALEELREALSPDELQVIQRFPTWWSEGEITATHGTVESGDAIEFGPMITGLFEAHRNFEALETPFALLGGAADAMVWLGGDVPSFTIGDVELGDSAALVILPPAGQEGITDPGLNIRVTRFDHDGEPIDISGPRWTLVDDVARTVTHRRPGSSAQL